MRVFRASEMIGGVRLARNPTAVQSGNRFATPLGERLRERIAATVCMRRAERCDSC